jgi:nucleoside 2-deoxyribosyltransferase
MLVMATGRDKVEQLEITSAIMDDKWDIFRQTMISDEDVSKIYLASPLGFAESTQDFMAVIESQIAACGYAVLNPWHLASSQQFEFEAASLIESADQRRQALRKVNMEVATGNEKAIRECQLVVAVLDGPEVSSGTASEIGFAYALGKRIYGYRSDFCRAGDNEGSLVNLQIEYWIENSGRCIVRNLDELRQELAKAAIM